MPNGRLGPGHTKRPETPVTLDPIEEAIFQAEFAPIAERLGLDPNPDVSEQNRFDYRAAWKAGQLQPGPDDHFDSRFKLEGHPRLIVEGRDTRTGRPVARKRRFN